MKKTTYICQCCNQYLYKKIDNHSSYKCQWFLITNLILVGFNINSDTSRKLYREKHNYIRRHPNWRLSRSPRHPDYGIQFHFNSRHTPSKSKIIVSLFCLRMKHQTDRNLKFRSRWISSGVENFQNISLVFGRYF